MAAIDPTEEVEEEDGKPPRRPRSTLKLIKQDYDNMIDGDDDDDDDSESEYLRDLLNGDDEDSYEADDDEANGGPSDPSKSKKALRAARLQELLSATKDEEDSDEEMADGEPQKKTGSKALTAGKAKGKGKEKALVVKDEDEEDESEEESDDDDDSVQNLNLQHYTICTLDTEAVSSTHAPSCDHARADTRTALPTAHRPDRWRGREGFLRQHWHPHRLCHWQLRH